MLWSNFCRCFKAHSIIQCCSLFYSLLFQFRYIRFEKNMSMCVNVLVRVHSMESIDFRMKLLFGNADKQIKFFFVAHHVSLPLKNKLHFRTFSMMGFCILSKFHITTFLCVCVHCSMFMMLFVCYVFISLFIMIFLCGYLMHVFRCFARIFVIYRQTNCRSNSTANFFSALLLCSIFLL